MADEGIPYYNYNKPETLIIETDYQFLTDNQFNKSILDTTKMHKFDRNISVKLEKAIYRLGYELSTRLNDERRKESFIKFDSTSSNTSFFCLGKLNLQSGVNSLIILESQGWSLETDDFFGKKLLLFNVKDNYLCSIVLLGLFRNNVSPCPSICVSNKIITETRLEERYFLFANFGHRFPMRNKVYFSTFTIDENGHVVFTKDKYINVPCSR